MRSEVKRPENSSLAPNVSTEEAVTRSHVFVGSLSRSLGLANDVVMRYFGAFSLVGGLILWEAAGHIWNLSWLPPITEVVGSLIDLIRRGLILSNLANSLKNFAFGFSIALTVGLFVGALMGRYRIIHNALDFYVFALFVSPTMVFVPIFFGIFGLSGATIIAVIVVYAIFVIIINTSTAIRTVDVSLMEMARSYGASEAQVFIRILVPASLPLIFAGIQLGLGRAVKGMINGEMFIALVGLGALSQEFGGRFEAANAMAIAMVVALVALTLNRVLRYIDLRLTHWTD